MDPEYISASPTVMAYDYATGDYFSPAYLGQQTPAQAAFAAAKAAEPILADMPSTAPLVAHPVPGYPKQGHVPTFTMPMNKGEWNIKGIDIPTYSPPLPPIPGSQWRTSPMPIDGAQLSAARPQFSAFAGYGAAQIDYNRPGIGRAREVQDGAYRYRQFADGAIMVLISARPDLLAPGTILTGTNAADPNYQRWVAITSKIGAWRDFVRAQTAGAASAFTDAALKAAAARRRRKPRTARVSGAPAPEAALPAEMAAEPMNYTPWLIGGAVVIAGIVALTLMGGKKSGKGSKA